MAKTPFALGDSLRAPMRPLENNRSEAYDACKDRDSRRVLTPGVEQAALTSIAA